MVAKQRNRVWLALSTVNFQPRTLCLAQLTVATSHSLIDLSSEPDARVFESGLQAIVDIPARWPCNICLAVPDTASHILIVASAAM